jgi:hypothetical protein
MVNIPQSMETSWGNQDNPSFLLPFNHFGCLRCACPLSGWPKSAGPSLSSSFRRLGWQQKYHPTIKRGNGTSINGGF